MSGHSLICGRTTTGKTFLARLFAWSAHRAGHGVIVLDSIGVGWPGKTYQDLGSFIAAAKASRQCLLIVDESGTTLGRYNAASDWITTTSRHWGHRAIVICHSLVDISTTVRSNCTTFYAFASSARSAAMLPEYCRATPADVAAVTELGKGEFLRLGAFTAPEKFRIEFAKAKIFKI